MTKLQASFIALLTLWAGTSQATLIDRGGGLIYDDVLNITWLQDANYAKTSGYDDDGLMSWDDAKGWASNLVFAGHDNWRLPKVVDTGIPGCNWGTGGTDCGSNVDPASGEMAYMYFINLSNADDLFVNVGPFINLQKYSYWYGDASIAPAYAGEVWAFTNYGGIQYEDPPELEFYAWAVRDGDVAPTNNPSPIPEPSTLALLLAGLSFLGLRQIKR